MWTNHILSVCFQKGPLSKYVATTLFGTYGIKTLLHEEVIELMNGFAFKPEEHVQIADKIRYSIASMPDMNIGALSWTDLNTHSIDLNQ